MIAKALLQDGRWCPRGKCQRAGLCQFHFCVSLTPAEAEAKQAEWAAAKARREEEERQEKAREHMRRRGRDARIEAMLEAHGLSLHDLEEWVKEIER